MRDFLEKLQRKMQTFMVGRYGQDALSLIMTRIALILLLITLFWRNPLLACMANILLVIAIFRMFSKNIKNRRQELAAYEKLSNKANGAVALLNREWSDRKTHRYFKCNCGKVVRVPKGVGKIEIKCPVCGAHFIKKV